MGGLVVVGFLGASSDSLRCAPCSSSFRRRFSGCDLVEKSHLFSTDFSFLALFSYRAVHTWNTLLSLALKFEVTTIILISFTINILSVNLNFVDGQIIFTIL